MAGRFNIETPRGRIVTTRTRNGNVTSRLEWNSGFAPNTERNFSTAQEFVDSECIRRMNPFTPRLTSVLIKSATLGTVIGSGKIEQIVPYSRRQYYENKGEGQRGAKWFERMKAANKESILKGANRIAGGQ